MELDAVDVMKVMDPLSWDLAKSEWLDAEVIEGTLFTFDGGAPYYSADDVRAFLDEAEVDLVEDQSSPSFDEAPR